MRFQLTISDIVVRPRTPVASSEQAERVVLEDVRPRAAGENHCAAVIQLSLSFDLLLIYEAWQRMELEGAPLHDAVYGCICFEMQIKF